MFDTSRTDTGIEQCAETGSPMALLFLTINGRPQVKVSLLVSLLLRVSESS